MTIKRGEVWLAERRAALPPCVRVAAGDGGLSADPVALSISS